MQTQMAGETRQNVKTFALHTKKSAEDFSVKDAFYSWFAVDKNDGNIRQQTIGSMIHGLPILRVAHTMGSYAATATELFSKMGKVYNIYIVRTVKSVWKDM